MMMIHFAEYVEQQKQFFICGAKNVTMKRKLQFLTKLSSPTICSYTYIHWFSARLELMCP